MHWINSLGEKTHLAAAKQKNYMVEFWKKIITFTGWEEEGTAAAGEERCGWGVRLTHPALGRVPQNTELQEQQTNWAACFHTFFLRGKKYIYSKDSLTPYAMMLFSSHSMCWKPALQTRSICEHAWLGREKEIKKTSYTYIRNIFLLW